jgi:hypothetical protein
MPPPLPAVEHRPTLQQAVSLLTELSRITKYRVFHNSDAIGQVFYLAKYKDLEGSGRGLILKVLWRNSNEGTEEKKISHSGNQSPDRHFKT